MSRSLPNSVDNDLSKFRYHTGATLRPLETGEPCPILFRDVGPRAMRLYLDGQLQQLSGPFSPITYMRTCEYREPYIDYGEIGRLVFLAPLDLQPWHSGVETIYVCHARRMPARQHIGFVPGDMNLHEAAKLFANATTVLDQSEIVGQALWRDMVENHVERLDALLAELEQTERIAEPLRRQLQSGDRQRARETMARHDLNESDLCTAWHHLPAGRRQFIAHALQELSREG